MKDTENARKIPSQARSRATLDIILEAAAQLLESVGESGFNTNALAERAGVSIGTLYRYFPDKQSIIAALARQEKAAFEKAVETVLAGGITVAATGSVSLTFAANTDAATSASGAAATILLYRGLMNKRRGPSISSSSPAAGRCAR